MSITTSSDYPLGSVPYDMGVASVSADSSYSDYSTIDQQEYALKVPLGSQLNLLNAYNAGNPYLDYERVQNMQLGSLSNVLQGYSTLSGQQQGPYAKFGYIYGK